MIPNALVIERIINSIDPNFINSNNKFIESQSPLGIAISLNSNNKDIV